MSRAARLVIVNLAGLVAILLALEAVSRLVHPVEFPDPLITRSDADWRGTRRYDPLLFWSLRPSIVGDDWMTNSLGLRGPEVPPKGPNEFRILSLGESTTFGRSVRYDETYSARLERGLDPIDGREVRVVNAGSPGYTLFQGVTYLRERGLALEPDAVLVYFGYNDFLRVAFRQKRDAGPAAAGTGLTDRELYEKRSGAVARGLHTLQRASNLVRVISFRGSSRAGPVALASDRVRVPESDRRELLGALRELCREGGIRLVVVIPWYRSFEDHAPLLREAGAWSEVTLVDLPALLGDLPRPRAHYFIDEVHPTAAGHRLIAQAIQEVLRASPPGRGPDPMRRSPR